MATNSLEVTLETITPIWTGGSDGKADRLHLTGIMGSLRWWYEVIVRGLGGWACDPTDPKKSKCLYDAMQPETFKEICDVCRIFGTTGWARRFRIVLTEDTEVWQKHPIYPEDSRIDVKNRVTFSLSNSQKQLLCPNRKVPNWYLNSSPLVGQIGMKIIPSGSREIGTAEFLQAEIIGGLIKFIADWSSLGAKPQMGLGVVDIVHINPLKDEQHLSEQFCNFVVKDVKEHIKLRQKENTNIRQPSNQDGPSLRNTFFARIHTQTDSIQGTFDLKYNLRKTFRYDDESRNERDLRHFVMGYVQGSNHTGAKVMISYPDANNAIRVWGWIPEEVSKFGTSREQVIKLIHSHLTTHYKISYWREFNSTRDTTRIQYTNPQEFLDSLLKGVK